MKKQGDNVSVTSTSSLPDSSQLNCNGYLAFSCLVAALASFNSGFNTGVANIPEATIRRCAEVEMIDGFPSCLPAGDLLWGVVIGLFALGGGFGGLSASRMLTSLGRRNTIILNNVFFIVGGILLGTSTTLAQMAVGRFIVGVGSGVSSVAVSTYIGEIATSKCRGALGTSLQFMMVVGILVSQAASLGLNYAPGWRVLFALTGVAAILQIILMPMCVETPSYLIATDKIEKAKNSLKKLRSGYSVDKEFDSLLDSQKEQDLKEEDGTSGKGPFKQLLDNKHQAKHLIIALVLHALQQFSGINGVMFYSTEIFRESFGAENAPYVTVGVGVLNVIVTIISVFLIDRVGRRPLLLLSLTGMSLSSVLIVIGSVYKIDILVVVCVLLFVASFAIGLGPIPWLIMPELFPTKTLSTASALAMGVNWFCNFAIGLIFPSLLSGLGSYTFVLFAAITAAGTVFIFGFIPETKGRSLEEIFANI